MGIAIRRSEDIKGFKFKSKELKLSQCADDTKILLDGSENSIRNVVKLLDSYTEISGLKVNYNKSELAPLGKSRMEIYTRSVYPGMTITLDKIKTLAITITTNGNTEDLIRYNFEEKKEKIKCIARSWSKRNLTLYGKVTIIKSSIIPQLTYPLSILPNPGHSYFKEIDKIILNFLWDNKPPKIKRNVVLLKHSQGGLGITDIYSYSKSVKFMWIKKMMDNSFDSSWKDLIQL